MSEPEAPVAVEKTFEELLKDLGTDSDPCYPTRLRELIERLYVADRVQREIWKSRLKTAGVPLSLVNTLLKDLDKQAANIKRQSEIKESGLPVIHITTAVHEAVKEGLAVLAGDPELYTRGQKIVNMVNPDEQHSMLIIDEVAPSVLTNHYLAKNAIFFEGGVETKPPPLLGTTIAEWKKYDDFRYLRGVSTVPLMGKDGSIITTSGYDRASQLYFHLKVDLEEIPECPTLEQAQGAARFFIEELLSDFEGVSNASKSVVLADGLSFFGREMIEGPTPVTVIDANCSRTGKTLLAKALGKICLGGDITTEAFVADEDEQRKTIISLLLKGSGLILIDNIKERVPFGKTTTLQNLFTSTVFGGRLLGTNNSADLPNRSIWLASGVNVEVASDCFGRFITCRFVSSVEHPENRDVSAFRCVFRADAITHSGVTRSSIPD